MKAVNIPQTGPDRLPYHIFTRLAKNEKLLIDDNTDMLPLNKEKFCFKVLLKSGI